MAPPHNGIKDKQLILYRNSTDESDLLAKKAPKCAIRIKIKESFIISLFATGFQGHLHHQLS